MDRFGFETLVVNRAGQAFFSGDMWNASTVGSMLGRVLEAILGAAGIAKGHWDEGQGGWPELSASWEEDTRKAGSAGAGKKFMLSGKVYRAITQKADGGVVRVFGSSADIYSSTRSGRKRITLGGVYADIVIQEELAILTVGFSGKLAHSAAFTKLRRDIGKNWALKHKLSISKTELAMERENHRAALSHLLLTAELAKHGIVAGAGPDKIRKFAAKGSLGFEGAGGKSKMLLARGDDNLGYANILQTGEFLGVRTVAGDVLNPRAAATLRKHPSLKGGTVERGKAFPLMPLRDSDDYAVQRALEWGLERVLVSLAEAA